MAALLVAAGFLILLWVICTLKDASQYDMIQELALKELRQFKLRELITIKKLYEITSDPEQKKIILNWGKSEMEVVDHIKDPELNEFLQNIIRR